MVADKESIGLSRVHIHYAKCKPPLQDIKGKGMVLYSAISSPLDRSKRFTLSSPGRPVHSNTVFGFSWKHSSHAAIAQRLFTHISTTVYSQVLIYTAESTEASWSERKCPNFETVTTGIRTRDLSIASPAFYQLSYRAPHVSILSINRINIFKTIKSIS